MSGSQTQLLSRRLMGEDDEARAIALGVMSTTAGKLIYTPDLQHSYHKMADQDIQNLSFSRFKPAENLHKILRINTHWQSTTASLT